jgi:hypothetical protein
MTTRQSEAVRILTPMPSKKMEMRRRDQKEKKKKT